VYFLPRHATAAQRTTARGIKPGLDFDVFTVQHSLFDSNFHGSFGLAWYQSDLEASSAGGATTTTTIKTIKTILLDQISNGEHHAGPVAMISRVERPWRRIAQDGQPVICSAAIR